MYPYVTFVKISSVGFLPPPPPSPLLPRFSPSFFSLSPLWVARAWLSVLLFCKLFPSNIYICFFFVFFCFLLFFVARNPHLYKFLSRLSRKGCRDEEGRGTQTGAFAWLKTLLKYQGGSCYSLLLTVIRQQLGNWWDNKNEMICAFHRSYQSQKRNWLWKRHTS